MKNRYKYNHKAIVTYDIKTLNSFFEDYDTYEDSIQKTCLYASNDGNYEIVKFITDNKKFKILDTKIIICAIDRNNLKIIELLLLNNYNEKDLIDDLIYLFLKVLNENNMTIFKTMVSSDTIKEILLKHYTYINKKLLYINNLNINKTIIEFLKIDTKFNFEYINEYKSKNDNEKLLNKFILEHNGVFEEKTMYNILKFLQERSNIFNHLGEIDYKFSLALYNNKKINYAYVKLLEKYNKQMQNNMLSPFIEATQKEKIKTNIKSF